MRFSTSFATAWFCAACSGAHFGDPHSDFCLTPLQTRSCRRTQLAHGSVTPSWHGGTGHTSAFALGDWGVGPTPSGGRSHGQGMLRKIHSGGFRAYPMKAQCFPVGHATQAELRSSLPQEAGLGTAPQGTESYHLHTASFQGQLKVGISALTLQIKSGTSQTASRSQDTATEPPGSSCTQVPSEHKPLVLYTRHWTNSSTNKIKSFLHTIRLLKN